MKTHKFPIMRLGYLSFLALLAVGCNTATPGPPEATRLAADCPVTQTEWFQPPEDDAFSETPEFGHYYVNSDQSIIASAWWTEEPESYLRAGPNGIKTGWFRPAGAELIITGYRLDDASQVLDAHVPCCYPSRFQAVGLMFPSEGCWQVQAKAGESELSFVVFVFPE